MVQILEADGWIWERTRGSHRVYTHSAKPGGVVVPGKLGRRYAVIVEQADDGGYGAWSPDLPGCVAIGDTVEECLAEMTARSSSTSTSCASTRRSARVNGRDTAAGTRTPGSGGNKLMRSAHLSRSAVDRHSRSTAGAPP
jgi:HicA toxin of bacterial toxin-antitoxin,/HicB_like antitoxin of bacterial toxin-antitoxin system